MTDALYRLAGLSCPACGKTLSGYVQLAGQASAPEAGSVVVCTGCAGILVLERTALGWGLHGITPEELADLAQEPAGWAAVRQMVAEVNGGYWRWRFPRGCW